MPFSRLSLPVAILAVTIVAIAFVACGSPPAQPAAPTPPPATATPAAAAPTPTTAVAPTPTTAAAADTPTPAPPTATAVSAATVAPTAAPAGEPAAASDQGVVFTLGDAAIARYKVEEVLANTGFKVATGETPAVSGAIAFDADGSIVAAESRIVVSAATLRTDSDRRDGYVRNRTLATDTYPEIVFRPTAADGLPWPLPEPGAAVHFTVTGDLTVRDRTREVAWDAMADFPGDGSVSGHASVEFTFADFELDKPRVAVVLSVEDTIRLELDFAGTVGPR